MTTTITEQELTEARTIWGDALVAVSKGGPKQAAAAPEECNGLGPGTAANDDVPDGGD